MSSPRETILILDFGGQYTQLIARRIRDLGVYSEIFPCTHLPADLLTGGYKGIVLSGGPNSVYDTDAPLPPTNGKRRCVSRTRPRR